jgi:uncharacterized protein with PIN domain
MIYNPKEHPLCPACKTRLQVGEGKPVAEDDDNPDTPTKIFQEFSMMCPNPKCGNYHGGQLNNLEKVVEVVRNQIN